MLQNLKQLASEIAASYPFRVKSMTLVQNAGQKVVWRLETEVGSLCLKRLPHGEDRSLFGVAAQEYVKSRGARVPAVIRTSDGAPYVVRDGNVYVVYEWLAGRHPRLGNLDDRRQLVQGMAMFHKASRGYEPPQGAVVSNKIGRWPEQYAQMIEEFREWKRVATASPKAIASRALLRHVDGAIERGERALAGLQASSYAQVCQEPIGLCHQDYGVSNCLLTPAGPAVIDLDGITFDLPARDIRKLLHKLFESRGGWSAATYRAVLAAYQEVYPLTPEHLDALRWDLRFPHPFFALAKNPFKKKERVGAEFLRDLATVAKTEESIWAGFAGGE